MAYIEINNGSFDFDPTADKVRISFDDVKTMFSEIFDKIPLDLSGEDGKILKVKATEDGFELVSASGSGDMLAANNLSDLDDAGDARTNLGLGSAAESDSGDFATDTQGGKADTAIQTLTAVSGITIDTSSPYDAQNPGLSVSPVTVTGLSFAPGTGVLTLAVDGATDITVDLSAYTVLKIDDYTVEKGSGNTDYETIENGDVGFGFEDDSFVAWEQVSGNKIYTVKNIEIDSNPFRYVVGHGNDGTSIQVGDIATGGIFSFSGSNFFGDLICIDATGDLTTGIGTKWQVLTSTAV